MDRLTGRTLNLFTPSFADVLIMCSAEFIATGLLIIFGCMGFLNSKDHDLFYDGIGYGMVVMILLVIFGHVSGGHFNPIVSIWAGIYGVLPFKLVPMYIISQFLGALLGYLILMGIMPEKYFYDGVCVTKTEDDDLTSTQAFFLEFACSLIIIWVYCGVWDQRSTGSFDSSALKIGFAYMQQHFVNGHLTGSGMNPARSFAAAICNNVWDNHWLYWIAPIIGSIVATLVYMLLLASPIEIGKINTGKRLFRYIHRHQSYH
ncbi:aquaporin-8-like [Chrysoperla carnea]|uniref:aquaporin-8-like n=1 Tax=Chrysoperla carnea TaxID=189513 RepID=UPI001D07BEA4|nr:aquaporin-8-like [Chrysoperla carnea]